LEAITGIAVVICKVALVEANVIAASLPTTCAAICCTTSMITG
jgi:hypothetical protein